MAVEDAKKILEEISEELQDLNTLHPREMLRYLMQFGSKLPALPKEQMTEDNFVYGCISNAYVYVEQDSSTQTVLLKGSSDAMVVKGFMGILASALKELSPQEVLSMGKTLIEDFLQSVELDIILTPTRANAFGNVVALILKKAESL